MAQLYSKIIGYITLKPCIFCILFPPLTKYIFSPYVKNKLGNDPATLFVHVGPCIHVNLNSPSHERVQG